MSAGTSAALSLLFVSIVFVSAEQKNMTAESGQNVTLTCRVQEGKDIRVVEWSRADLGDDHVLLYREGKFFLNEQHPSFKNRVDLQDRQMKDGDVSVILKDVTVNDTGTYECRVVQSGAGGLRLISSIYLRVVAPPPGPGGGTTEDGGSVGLIVGLSVPALLLVVSLVVFLIYRKHKKTILDSSHPPVEL